MVERIAGSTFQREKIRRSDLLLVAGVALFCIARLSHNQQISVFGRVEPLRPLGVNSVEVRSGLEQRLMLAGNGHSTTLEIPIQLGHLQPKGRVNPDGSEVWGYPEGSGA